MTFEAGQHASAAAVLLEPESAACVACGGRLGQQEHLGAVCLLACTACGTRTALPRPTAEEASRLHDSPEYFAKQYFDVRRGQDRPTNRRFERLRVLLSKQMPQLTLADRKMLDIGCDTGDFVLAAQTASDLIPYGVDVASQAIEIARSHGVQAFHGDVAAAPDDFAGFAIVTAIDVIEHVAEPVALLRAARSRLTAGGAIYVETPNWQSIVYAIGRSLARVGVSRPRSVFERLFPREHIQYFTQTGLEAAALRAGLRPRVVFTQPLRDEALAGGLSLRMAMAVAQLIDRATGRGILLSALLVPAEDVG